MNVADTAWDAVSALSIEMRDAWQPVRQEVTGEDLPVTGAIPDFLDGRYLRNGTNPVAEVDPATYHLFSGDAMVHGISLRDGQARWYRNRWIRTPSLSTALGESLTAAIKPRAGMTVVGPSTNVISHAGRTLALIEGGMACYELTDDLDTVGTCDFDGTLTGGYTAHPHIDPDTGEMHAVSYTVARPKTVEYSVIGTDGRTRRTVTIDVHGPTMMHDFTLTDKYVVFYDLPVTFDASIYLESMLLPRPLRKPAELVLRSLLGKFTIPGPLTASSQRFTRVKPNIPYSWNPGYPARIGVMPRDGGNADVRWIEIEPCYVFHPVNGYRENRDGHEVVVIDVTRYDSMFDTNHLAPIDGAPALHRWTIDLTDGVMRTEQLDDRWLEFPKINETLTGKKHRYAYLPDLGGVRPEGTADDSRHQLVKVDYQTGATQRTTFDPAVVMGEMSFVPAPGAQAEDDGVLIGYAHDRRDDAGQLHILDASTLEMMATVHLPQRVPAGFHGNWAPAATRYIAFN